MQLSPPHSRILSWSGATEGATEDSLWHRGGNRRGWACVLQVSILCKGGPVYFRSVLPHGIYCAAIGPSCRMPKVRPSILALWQLCVGHCATAASSRVLLACRALGHKGGGHSNEDVFSCPYIIPLCTVHSFEHGSMPPRVLPPCHLACRLLGRLDTSCASMWNWCPTLWQTVPADVEKLLNDEGVYVEARAQLTDLNLSAHIARSTAYRLVSVFVPCNLRVLRPASLPCGYESFMNMECNCSLMQCIARRCYVNM